MAEWGWSGFHWRWKLFQPSQSVQASFVPLSRMGLSRRFNSVTIDGDGAHLPTSVKQIFSMTKGCGFYKHFLCLQGEHEQF